MGSALPARGARKRKPLVPTWIPADHPLFLNKLVRARIRRSFDPRGIFLNIPYGPAYSKFEIAIISTVTAYGITPRMARERTRMEVRLHRIVELMLGCSYGLTDLSYPRRMNMPLELGLLPVFGKDSFVMTASGHSALRTISDLNFCDPHQHGGSVRRLIAGLSRWIEQNCSPKRLKAKTLLGRYRRLSEIRERLGAKRSRC